MRYTIWYLTTVFYLVGDFQQLKPIPGPLDVGSYIFTSQLFNEVLPHRFELQVVMRQGKGENNLKEALDSLWADKCDGEVEEYFQHLEKGLDNMSSEAINIYFNNYLLSSFLYRFKYNLKVPAKLLLHIL